VAAARAARNSTPVSQNSDFENQMDGGRFQPVPLACVECGSLSGRDARRWRSYRIDDPTEDEEPALAFYCPSCAEREFGTPGPDPEYRWFEA
jgi:hypothetical protein